MLTVSWVSLHRDVKARGMWDQRIVEILLEATGIEMTHTEGWGGAVVVIGGRHHADDLDHINERINRQSAVVLFVTSDEEGVFPWWELRHPNMRLWVQTPRRSHDRVFGVGPSPHESQYLERDLRWCFAGQVTHHRRRRLAETLEGRTDGKLIATPGFTQGLPPTEYMTLLARSKIALCPSGPVTPDTFRLYEAIESGCLPVVDEGSDSDDDYWWRTYQYFPVPKVQDWADLDLDKLDWPTEANRISSWWSQWKHDTARRIRQDLRELFSPPEPSLTVLVPTSPIPSHPSVEIISETLTSIRERTDAQIIVMADGVRPEQSHLRDAYEGYLHRLLWASHKDPRLTVIRYEAWLHQAEMTGRTLELVDTPAVMFVEHDTPLIGDIPLDDLTGIVSSGAVQMIRLHHETHIHAEHEYLMGEKIIFADVPLRQTRQWSQRPHLANADAYRGWLADWFRPDSRSMIEDRMHGIVQSYPWGRFRLAIYNPEGNMKRSTHLDGRGDEPKYGMSW